MAEVGTDLWRPCGSSPLLQSGVQNHVHIVLEYLQGWRWLHRHSEEPVPVLSHPNSKNVFPGVQREPPVFQFVLTASGPITGHCWEESGFIFTASFQVFIHINKNFLCFFFSTLSSPGSFSLSLYERCSRLFIILVAPHWALSTTSMSLFFWGTQNWAQHWGMVPSVLNKGEGPAVNTSSNAIKDTIYLFCISCTLLVHVQPGVYKDLQVVLLPSSFPTSVSNVVQINSYQLFFGGNTLLQKKPLCHKMLGLQFVLSEFSYKIKGCCCFFPLQFWKYYSDMVQFNFPDFSNEGNNMKKKGVTSIS